MVVARENTPYKRQGDHPGLLAQRFALNDSNDSKSFKLEALKRIKGALEKAADAYKPAFNLWDCSFKSTSENRKRGFDVAFQNPQRVIVGLGSDSVIETGVTLLHTYGVPYLPGSSIKGMTSSYCNEYYGSQNANFKAATEKQKQGDVHRLIFGSTEASGLVVFHDAWIGADDAKNSLQLDIMTPHHDKYNGGGDKPPTDFDNPTPVQFLSVVGKFRVYLTIEEYVDNETANVALDLTAKLVREAFQRQGIGGKTSSGYGFAKVVDAPVQEG